MREKATWLHPRSRHWYLLDYVLVRRRNQWDVLMTKAIPGVDGWTDNHLVISNMRIRLQPRRRPQGELPSGKLNIALSQNGMLCLCHHLHFSNESTQRLANLPVGAEENACGENRWCQLRDIVQSMALDVLGRARHQHPASFDAAISNLLVKENREMFVDRAGTLGGDFANQRRLRLASSFFYFDDGDLVSSIDGAPLFNSLLQAGVLWAVSSQVYGLICSRFREFFKVPF
ncbi:hypothetical protein SprV_0602129700 [Sparganum proliferum]